MEKKQAELRAWDPPLRDKIAYGLSDLLGLTDRTKNNYAIAKTRDALDWVPGLGDLLGVDDAKRDFQAGNYGMAAAGLGLTAAGVIPGADIVTQPVKKGIRAFHGSPHGFDKFDMSKIGTGEGAQAYGHGLYFAENEGVAKSYRDNLSRPSFINTASGTPVSPGVSRLIEDSYDELLSGPGNMSSNIPRDSVRRADQRLEQQLDDARAASDFDWYNQVLDQKREVQRLYNDPFPNQGSMYEVNIDADPEQFLDWDKPLSDVPENIRPMLQEHVQTGAYTRAQNSGIQSERDKLFDLADNPTNAPISFAHDQLKRPEFTEQLRREGIPGIKYLDQGSRGAADGSRNYVVFDENLISIVKKYGIPAALGAGLITEEMARQMQEQGLGQI